MSENKIISAFSEKQAIKLSGLSAAQLASWRRSNFVRPSLKNENSGYFSYIYSFKDLVLLRVLNSLRNDHGVSIKELKNASVELKKLGIESLAATKLWVHRKKVVFEEPKSNSRREATSKQFVAEIPLAVVVGSLKEEISKLNARGEDQIGRVEKRRGVLSSTPVFAGTRIPLKTIFSYLEAGKTNNEILDSFPRLTVADIEYARQKLNEVAA